ncbi:MAG: DNA recombination protein RmuC [bacterium]|nr:MAG: DNA recombination protein RmuC [bacterium]KAF0147772.1 MAG: DNA recombination protein RmuC [bacterium]KAF0167853.1 MAG: DNA recombination protein RmuC [bacterium]TXT19861.1 MAG: DNA recombination protein RmuC [bacterium]
MEYVIVGVLGLALGLLLLLWQRGRWLAENARLTQQVAGLSAQLEQETHQAEAKQALLREAEQHLADAFNALSAQALARNNQAFLDLARQNLAVFQEAARGDLAARQQAVESLVKPLAEELAKLAGQTQSLEKARAESHGQLSEQLKGLLSAQQDLRGETGRLVNALRRPEVRGRWGEVQLKRVVEMAGMLDRCDFYEQEVAADGKRPDMLVRLPGGKTLVLDSKAPVAAFLEAAEALDDGARGRALERFAQHVRTHIQQLSQKAYWEQFEDAPEFVVMFLPGESFFSAALQQDPALIEYASERKVILATPTTLLALLKAVYYGWRQESLADNARQVSELGAQLYERLAKLGEHWASVGKNLGQAVKAYNEATGSLESRVMVSARKFEELHVAPEGKKLPELNPVEQAPRALQLVEGQGSDTRFPSLS